MAKANEVLAHWAQAGAAMGADCGKMCSQCIFKAGTVPNLDMGALIDVHGCFYREKEFHCAHVGAPDGEEPVCAGFKYALAYLKSGQILKDQQIKKPGQCQALNEK